MKNILSLCTKNVHFTFTNEIYTRNDGVAMFSSIGPAFAGIFIIELINTLVLKLRQHMQNWRRYEHDNFAYMKNGSIEYPGKRKLLETQITFIQPYIEKKSTIIYTYIGMILCLYLAKVKYSES